MDWTIEDWSRVFWNDESKFCGLGPSSEGKIYIRRKINEELNLNCIVHMVKRGGGAIQVWGCFSMHGMELLHRIHGIMDQYVYKDMIKNVLLPYTEDFLPVSWIYMQDCDPKHVAKSVQKLLEEEQVQVLDWPAQFADLIHWNMSGVKWDEL